MNFVVGQIIFTDAFLLLLLLLFMFFLAFFSAFKIMLIFSVHLFIDLDFCIDE